MAWCAANNCFYRTDNNPEKVIFFSLPKNKKIKNEWLTRIKRVSFPKNVTLCSRHFEEDCFDASWDLQHRLSGPKFPARKLLPHAVPTLFHYNNYGKPSVIRDGSRKRNAARKQKEVGTCITTWSDVPGKICVQKNNCPANLK